MPLKIWHLAMWLQVASNISIPSIFSRDMFKAAIKNYSELTASSWCSYRRDSWTIVYCKKSFCILPLVFWRNLKNSSHLQLFNYCSTVASFTKFSAAASVPAFIFSEFTFYSFSFFLKRSCLQSLLHIGCPRDTQAAW